MQSPQAKAATPAASRYQLARSLGTVEADADQDADHRSHADALVDGVVAGRPGEREVPGRRRTAPRPGCIFHRSLSMLRLPRPAHPSLSALFPCWLSTGAHQAHRPTTDRPPDRRPVPGRTPPLRWATDADPRRQGRERRPAPHRVPGPGRACSPAHRGPVGHGHLPTGVVGQGRAQPRHRHGVDAAGRAGAGRRHLRSPPHAEPRRRGQRALGRVDAAPARPGAARPLRARSPARGWRRSTP